MNSSIKNLQQKKNSAQTLRSSVSSAQLPWNVSVQLEIRPPALESNNIEELLQLKPLARLPVPQHPRSLLPPQTPANKPPLPEPGPLILSSGPQFNILQPVVHHQSPPQSHHSQEHQYSQTEPCRVPGAYGFPRPSSTSGVNPTLRQLQPIPLQASDYCCGERPLSIPGEYGSPRPSCSSASSTKTPPTSAATITSSHQAYGANTSSRNYGKPDWYLTTSSADTNSSPAVPWPGESRWPKKCQPQPHEPRPNSLEPASASESPRAARSQLGTLYKLEAAAAARHHQHAVQQRAHLYSTTATARNPLQRAAELDRAVGSICAADPPGTIRNSSINELPDPSATPLAQPPLRGYDEQGNQPVNRPLSREVVVTMERTPFKYKELLASQDPSVYLVPAPQHQPAPQPQLQQPPCHSSSYMQANGHHPPHYRRMKGAIGNWRRRRNVTTHMMEIGDSLLRAEHTLGRMNRRRQGHTLRQSKDSNANP
ncbi:hypothetical protein PCASD_26887 [Puccinia coronata f. sp. avenae]|uniref:Uncharacterized protein n=1 Tax=Puccinia coronata f. sp. avenae TaxID=200324 RepID=A0A2N5RVB9_9BASI|nr:hypothetical protein PCASD_26887 [Puccinia coronata f. sp. avenae]